MLASKNPEICHPFNLVFLWDKRLERCVGCSVNGFAMPSGDGGSVSWGPNGKYDYSKGKALHKYFVNIEDAPVEKPAAC